MKINIIVLAYNGGEDLMECVASLYAHTPLNNNVQLTVVDNASTDGSLARVAQAWPQLEIIYNTRNLGFGAGNNVGMRRALAAEAEAVVLLNQDLVVTAGWLEPLIETLKPSAVGIAQALILLKKNPQAINARGCDLHIFGFGAISGYKETVANAATHLVGNPDIPYAMGAAVAIKREVLEAVGLFDEAAFMYHDDMDLCLRARLRGWRIVLAPQSRVWHDYKEAMSERTYYGLEINRLWNPLKFYRLGTLGLLFPLWFLFEGVSFAYAWRHGWLGPWWRARRDTLKQIQHLRQWRRNIQNTRTVSDRVLLKTALASFPAVRTAGLVEKSVRTLLSLVAVIYWSIVRQLIFW